MTVACGVPGGDLIGLTPQKTGRVVYLAGEDNALMLTHRIHAMGKHLSPEAIDDISRNLIVEPLAGSRVNIMSSEGKKHVLSLAQNPRLIILDTISRFHELDENSNGDMARLVSTLEELAAASGAAVLFIHHVSKSSGRDGIIDQQSSRGASALIDNGRWCGYLVQMTSDEALRLVDSQTPSSPIGSHYRQYVRLGENKRNYGAATAEHRWFKRTEGGVLVPTTLEAIRDNTAQRRKGAPIAFTK